MIGKIGLMVGVALNVAILVLSHPYSSYGYELRGNLWKPGKQILHGRSPYDLETPKRALAEGKDCCIQALYPAPTHVFFAPFSLLPFEAAMIIWTLLSTAALLAGFWLLGMRSSAAFGLLLLSPPVWTGTQVGSVIPFLVLGCALCWRWRDRPYLGGITVAATAVLKIFLWPLWLWLLFTRRYRAAIASAVAAVVMLAAGWAVFGFQDLLAYPQLLSNVAKLEQGHSISLARFTGEWFAVAVFLALVVVGRRSFSAMIVASLVLLPIVWVHTFQVLLVPAALMSMVYVLQAARWRVLADARAVRLTRFVGWVVGSVAVNNVVPGRVGDVLRAEWLSRGTRRARASSISSVIVDRGFDIVTLVAALALTYPFVPHAAWLRDFRLVAGAVGLLVGASFLAAVVYARRSRVSAPRGLLGTLKDVVQRTGDLVHRGSRARAGLLSAMAWAAWSGSAWLVASALGIALTPVEALFVTAVLNLGAAIPSSPGFIGTYQWLGVSALTVLGVGHTPAFAFSVLMHAVWFVPTTMAGAALALFKSTPAATALPPRLRSAIPQVTWRP